MRYSRSHLDTEANSGKSNVDRSKGRRRSQTEAGEGRMVNRDTSKWSMVAYAPVAGKGGRGPLLFPPVLSSQLRGFTHGRPEKRAKSASFECNSH